MESVKNTKCKRLILPPLHHWNVNEYDNVLREIADIVFSSFNYYTHCA